MRHVICSIAVLAIGGTLIAAGPQATPQQTQTPPPPSQQPQDISLGAIRGQGGLPPKLAVAAVLPLSSDSETTAAAKTIADVLYDDLGYDREYYMIGKDVTATIPKPTSLDSLPLDGWKQVNADGVVVGTIQKTATGVIVQVKLIQVATGKAVFAKEYSGSIANPRAYAHTISDEIYKQQLGENGVARTKLAFASDRDNERVIGSVEKRDVEEIYFTDYDGANARRVTNTKTLNITPSWSPDGQAIAYGSYRPSGQFGTFTDIVVSYIYKGVRETPAHGDVNRQNYLPVWSPDGTKIAFMSNRDGNDEIYVMNRDGSGLHRMTNNPAIDSTPTWSPTGNQIAWVSDRSGAPNIYIMNADGTGQRKLTSQYSDRPTWSPAPFNEIAYSVRSGPGFDVMIYSFENGESHRLTDGIGSNESPSFSPNGRHVAFASTRNGKWQIFTIDRDGQNLRQITREGNNKFPNWSR